MAEVIFYEKPGCINNTKQKKMLAAAGHEVMAKNLLTEAWDIERLQAFFAQLPLSEWFNRSAPRVRDGEVVPEQLAETEALQMMVAEPLLIRRPLMIIGGVYQVGFDAKQLNRDFSLGLPTEDEELESCPKSDKHEQACEVSA